MLHSKGWSLLVAALSLVASGASAQKIVPSPLLAIDQNRTTVVDRIVSQWGDSLATSNAGIGANELRQMLSAMRSDQLLAASLAGTLEGLRDVVANALVATSPAKSGLLRAKALGDPADDLVYTPVVPCRLADTRVAGGAIAGGNTRDFKVWVSSGGFTAQGGDPGNCNVPPNPPAVALNLAAVNPGGLGNLIAYPTGAPLPNTSVLNYQTGTFALANGAIIPACVPNCTNQVTLKANGAQVDVVIDVVGYFMRPSNYGGTHIINSGENATDSGGFSNTASGPNSTVAGGNTNVASGGESTVGGGQNNKANCPAGCTVAGGSGNTASGMVSTISGGLDNTASGDYSTVAGGYANIAGGKYSYAAGTLTNAEHDGCFVWGDDSNTGTLTCLTPNEVDMRAFGGFYFLTGLSGPNYTGADLLPGASAWTTHSDRNSKDHILPVDAREVLSKVAQLPIATWNWKSQDPMIRHMGPMAQDFHAAFGLGETPKGISTVDSEGVALAAIQGLYQLLQDKDARIAALEQRLAAVEASTTQQR